MTSLDTIADALIGGDPTPVLVFIDERGEGMAAPLVDPAGTSDAVHHPIDVLAAVPVGAGLDWHAVAVLTTGTARDLETGQSRGRLVTAMAISRTGYAARVLWADGVISYRETDNKTAEGAIPEAVRQFLAGQPVTERAGR